MSTSTIPFSFFQPLVSIICSCTLKITAVFFWSVLHSSHPFWYPDTISVHLCFSSNLSHLCSFVPSLTMFFSLFHCYCFCCYYYYLCYYCYHCCWVCCILMKGRVQTVALGHNMADKVCFQVKTLLSMWAASNKVIYLCFYTSLFYFNIIFICYYCCLLLLSLFFFANLNYFIGFKTLEYLQSYRHLFHNLVRQGNLTTKTT